MQLKTLILILGSHNVKTYRGKIATGYGGPRSQAACRYPQFQLLATPVVDLLAYVSDREKHTSQIGTKRSILRGLSQTSTNQLFAAGVLTTRCHNPYSQHDRSMLVTCTASSALAEAFTVNLPICTNMHVS